MMIVNFSRKIFAIKPVNCFIAHSVVQTHIHIYVENLNAYLNCSVKHITFSHKKVYLSNKKITVIVQTRHSQHIL